MYPTPVWDLDSLVWRVDLRSPWRLGRRTLDAPPPPAGLVAAVHAARDLLESLRAEYALSDAQLTLPETCGRCLAAVLDEWLRERKFSSVGGERWVRETSALLRKELGRTLLRDLVPPGGTRLVWAYRDRVRGLVGAKAMQSRLLILSQVLRWAASPPRMWLPALPVMPSPKLSPDEVIRNSLDKWIDEPTFRATRARIYEHQTARNQLAAILRLQGFAGTAAEVRDLVERRKLYLSVAYYTGMRKHDLDLVDDGYFALDFDCYYRHGRKTGIERAAEALCPPLARDIAAERQRLGRPWRAGEAICGGPWKNVCRVVATAADLAGVERWNLRDCRRSFVYQKALAGVSEHDLVNLLGHADSRMVRTVYLQLQPRLQRNLAGAAWPVPVSLAPGTGNARVIAIGQASRPLPSQGQKHTKGGS